MSTNFLVTKFQTRMLKKNISVIIVMIIALIMIALVVVISNNRIRKIDAKATQGANF